MPAPSGERATLSRDLADFLIELSIALHKHAMYPEGHPSLAPAAAGLTRRAALLLEDRATISLGVARNQLVIEGVATDPKHPVLRELAGRLHRHHLGAITFRRGVEQAEVADALRTLAIEAERTGQPLGLGDRDRLAAWPHVQLHALTYERLELTDQAGPVGEGDARAAQLWVGLARAALATAPEDTRPTPTEPAVIAQAIDQHSKAEATGYDQVIVGYLLQIAAELKTAGSAEAGRCGGGPRVSFAPSSLKRCSGWCAWGATSRSGASSSPMRPTGWRWMRCSTSSRPPRRARRRLSPIRSCACCRNWRCTQRRAPHRCDRKPMRLCANRFSGCWPGGRSPIRIPARTARRCTAWPGPRRPGRRRARITM